MKHQDQKTDREHFEIPTNGMPPPPPLAGSLIQLKPFCSSPHTSQHKRLSLITMATGNIKGLGRFT